MANKSRIKVNQKQNKKQEKKCKNKVEMLERDVKYQKKENDITILKQFDLNYKFGPCYST